MPNLEGNQQNIAFKCKQELSQVKDGDAVYIATEGAAMKGTAIAALDGGFTLLVEEPIEKKGVQIEIRLRGAGVSNRAVPINESFFYTAKAPDGGRQPEQQSGRLKEVRIGK